MCNTHHMIYHCQWIMVRRIYLIRHTGWRNVSPFLIVRCFLDIIDDKNRVRIWHERDTPFVIECIIANILSVRGIRSQSTFFRDSHIVLVCVPAYRIPSDETWWNTSDMIDFTPIDDNRRTLVRRHRASPINAFKKRVFARFTVNAVNKHKRWPSFLSL